LKIKSGCGLRNEDYLVLLRNFVSSLDCTQKQWADILKSFDDAYIYQTWAYGAVRWGSRNIRHLLLKENNEVVSAAQVRVIKPPLLRMGIAYVTWGPIWRRRGKEEDVTVLVQMFKALRQEFSMRRGLFLRVIPSDQEENNESLKEMLIRENFEWQPHSYRTIIMNLNLAEEELRRSMRNTWRQSLQKAEKLAMTIEEGTSEELFGQALNIYLQMYKRKGFMQHVSMREYKEIQRHLEKDLKMTISLCRLDAEAIGALVYSAIGHTGIPILAATGNNGLKSNALNLLYWRMIKRLKEKGCMALNLGGISIERNPGGHTWKTGLSGKLGREIGKLGEFDYCSHSVTSRLIRYGDRMKKSYTYSNFRR
jgi:lipid II:glycine glycyltransferase (peptidoglycan interpeptide bridge formation enzyme)